METKLKRDLSKIMLDFRDNYYEQQGSLGCDAVKFAESPTLQSTDRGIYPTHCWL
jgi:hypothetical protein